MEDMSVYEDESFDIVLTSNVLCSVDDVEKCLSEIHRVLKKVVSKISFNIFHLKNATF